MNNTLTKKLEEAHKKHKKKKLPKINTNAGNVEAGINFFNRASGATPSDTADMSIGAIAEAIVRERHSSVTKELFESKNLNEKIEIHDELNPKLWDGDTLKAEVKKKIVEIVKTFLEKLKRDNVGIKVKDIVIVGSNVNYNYTEQSDLDIHIISDTKDLLTSKEDLDKIYSAYKSIFNSTYDISLNGVPVELYIEQDDITNASNGVYSLLTGWIKLPEKKEIPNVDETAFNAAFEIWERKYQQIIAKNPLHISFIKIPDIDPEQIKNIQNNLTALNYNLSEINNDISIYNNSDLSIKINKNTGEVEKSEPFTREELKGIEPQIKLNLSEAAAKADNLKQEISNIQRLIDDLYILRKQSIEKEGEYSQGNLIFKEFRNKGYLDVLKELKINLENDELSLEPEIENLIEAKLNDRKAKIIKRYRKLANLSPEETITAETFTEWAVSKVAMEFGTDDFAIEEILLNN